MSNQRSYHHRYPSTPDGAAPRPNNYSPPRYQPSHGTGNTPPYNLPSTVLDNPHYVSHSNSSYMPPMPLLPDSVKVDHEKKINASNSHHRTRSKHKGHNKENYHH